MDQYHHEPHQLDPVWGEGEHYIIMIPEPLGYYSFMYNSTHQRVSPSEDAVLVESLPKTAVSSLSLTPPRLKGLDHLLSGTDQLTVDIRMDQDFSVHATVSNYLIRIFTVWVGNLAGKMGNESFGDFLIFLGILVTVDTLYGGLIQASVRLKL